MYQENIREEAIRKERTRIAGELDTLLQTFLSASMQLGAAADSLPSDSPVKPRLDRILQVMDEGTKQGLNTIQSWLSSQPPKRKAESQLYLFEVTAQEKEIIESGLRECQGREFGPSGVAAKLGFARSRLESKIRSLKIDKNRFRVSRVFPSRTVLAFNEDRVLASPLNRENVSNDQLTVNRLRRMFRDGSSGFAGRKRDT